MHNIKAVKQYLVDFFSEGSKEHGDFSVGVELEHFVTEKDSSKSVSYYGNTGVGQILHDLLPLYPYSFFENNEILGFANDDYSITLEPGSQLEISIHPQKSIASVREIYKDFRNTFKSKLDELNYDLSTYGYLPSSSISEIKLLPKQRYEYMDRHFQKTGTMGRNMMRGTASCQVSIDYCSEADFIRKIRCAYLISPIISYITSNSPIFEEQSNTNALLRTKIWRNTDKNRAGIIPGLFDDDFGFEKYADYVLNAPAIFRIKDGGFFETALTALEIMQEADDIAEAAELYISLVFPDVRLKQYVEIRVADSMPIERVLGYTALIKGLFHNIEDTEALFGKECFNEESIINAQDNLMSGNLAVYGESLGMIIEKLTAVAKNGLDTDEQQYLQSIMVKGV